MNENVIYQHKEERDKGLSKDYIERNGLKDAKKGLDSGLIKVITGPRRAGKSVFSFLLLKEKNFAYVNFDDENVLKIQDTDQLLSNIFAVYGDIKYIFFDEIQNLSQWELFINKLHRRGFNIVLTGSNAHLLSRELSTHLTGRYIPIEILPFSFNEYLLAKGFEYNDSALPEKKGLLLNHLKNFLTNGGYPEPTVNNLEIRPYLSTLFEAILFKDVIKRYRVKYSQDIYNLALFLISNFCSEYSATSLRKALNFRSTKTVQNYLGYLEETYLFFSLNRFDFKMKEQVRAPRKIYLIDNGYVLANAFQLSTNTGKLLENLVFVTLVRAGFRPNLDLFYYKTRNKKEIDFVLKKGVQINTLIQVCVDIKDEKTKTREIKALLEASEELKCNVLKIITYDHEGIETHHGKVIHFIPLWRFLLNKKTPSTYEVEGVFF